MQVVSGLKLSQIFIVASNLNKTTPFNWQQTAIMLLSHLKVIQWTTRRRGHALTWPVSVSLKKLYMLTREREKKLTITLWTFMSSWVIQFSKFNPLQIQTVTPQPVEGSWIIKRSCVLQVEEKNGIPCKCVKPSNINNLLWLYIKVLYCILNVKPTHQISALLWTSVHAHTWTDRLVTCYPPLPAVDCVYVLINYGFYCNIFQGSA